MAASAEQRDARLDWPGAQQALQALRCCDRLSQRTAGMFCRSLRQLWLQHVYLCISMLVVKYGCVQDSQQERVSKRLGKAPQNVCRQRCTMRHGYIDERGALPCSVCTCAHVSEVRHWLHRCKSYAWVQRLRSCQLVVVDVHAYNRQLCSWTAAERTMCRGCEFCKTPALRSVVLINQKPCAAFSHRRTTKAPPDRALCSHHPRILAISR